jgi:hypothetical protein
VGVMSVFPFFFRNTINNFFTAVELYPNNNLSKACEIANFIGCKLESVNIIKSYFVDKELNFKVALFVYDKYEMRQKRLNEIVVLSEFIDNFGEYVERYSVASKLLKMGALREFASTLSGVCINEIKILRNILKLNKVNVKEAFYAEDSHDLFNLIEEKYRGADAYFEQCEILDIVEEICGELVSLGYMSALSHLVKTLEYHQGHGVDCNSKGELYYCTRLLRSIETLYEKAGRNFTTSKFLIEKI